MASSVGIEWVVLDIETDIEADEIVLIAFYDPSSSTPYTILPVQEMKKEVVQQVIKEIYRENGIIGHNLSFDLGFIYRDYGLLPPEPTRIFDTMQAEQLLTAGFDTELVNLKDTVYRHLGVELDKSLQTSFKVGEPVTEEQLTYLKHDLQFPYALRERQEALIRQHELETIWDIEQHCLPVFVKMVQTGVEIDLDALYPLLDDARIQRDALQTELEIELTPHVEWKRIAQFDTMQKELDDWLALFEEAENEYRDEWNSIMSLTRRGIDPPSEWSQNRLQKTNWWDESLNKKDGYPEGMRRYVKSRLSDWRKSYPRPPRPKLDTDVINLNSQPQMMAVMESLGVELKNLRSKTVATAMLDQTPEVQDMLSRLLAYKKAEKLLTSFGDKMIARMRGKRLHGSFRQIGTATGRPSCSEPNMLNMPKNQQFRSCFVASEGMSFVVSDYSQMELRIMAQLSGDKAMMKAFRSDLDLHTYTASLMFGVPMEKVTSSQRKTAKIINFGIMYGMGPTKLREELAAEGVILTKQEAITAVNDWRRTYRDAAKWIEERGKEATKNGSTSTPFGRKRFFRTTFADRGEEFAVARAGANHPIQGTNADITKLAMALLDDALDGRGTIVLQIYDEIVVECPDYLADWALILVEYTMRLAAEAVLTDVPAAVDARVAKTWGEE